MKLSKTTSNILNQMDDYELLLLWYDYQYVQKCKKLKKTWQKRKHDIKMLINEEKKVLLDKNDVLWYSTSYGQ